ncbi:MAG: pantoate--beta-alanine ligase [Candidatus Omnitrophica bacterium]|nr:pantoate--beta-alanine ligase [Candidatus Omnitrophota bacterium]
MQTVTTIKSLRKILKPLKQQGKTIGFVPTMGALHEGHLSLMRKARRECDIVVVSIFINPKQFGPNEDFTRYPRQKKKDELLTKKEKIDIMWHPSEEEMYPDGYLTYVETVKLGNILCGEFRPGHFKGVTTVVAKLLNCVTPDNLYLGQKDGQQAMILTKMVEDLDYDVKVKICPTLREKDGLALSSRNVFLTESQRREAPILYKALQTAKKAIKAGERDAQTIVQSIRSLITKESSGKIDYISCVDRRTLSSLQFIQGSVMIALAVRFGAVRLIDNIVVQA